MLIFPSWLYHGVEPNLSEAPRASLSFNFRLNWKGRS
jgi:ectoine hydroxylase-related dioxygenase (phytanoyl-CoA dioxygenase family)